MTITYTMVDYGDDNGVYKAWSTSKTYTESNKDEYITEILIPNQNKSKWVSFGPVFTVGCLR